MPSYRQDLNYPLPEDLKSIIQDIHYGDNAYLFWNRYVAWDRNDFAKTPNEKVRKAHFEELKNGFDWSVIIHQLNKRNNELKASLKKQGYQVETIPLQTDWRLVTGLGAGGALEVGFTLHPLYGFPYLPASSVKGVARAWAELAEDNQDDLKEKIRETFGSYPVKGDLKEKTTNQKESDNKLGDVIFLDAFPDGSPELIKDIMNPHYGPYYDQPVNKPPGDWYNPVPITFITVQDTQFNFILASRNADRLQLAKFWLIAGLTHLGIGAKTSAGYGYFQEPEEQRKAQEAKAQAEEEKPVIAEEPEKGAPPEIPQFDKVSQGMREVVAEVINKDQKPIKVRLLGVEGHDETVLCSISNPDHVSVGEKIYVTIAQYIKEKDEILMTRFERKFGE